MICLFKTTMILNAQNPFGVLDVSSNLHSKIVTYDGSSKVIADSDILQLDAFKFTSIGKLRKMEAVANGLLYIIFTYDAKQYIVVESSNYESGEELSKWTKYENEDIFRVTAILDYFHIKMNRHSYTMVTEKFRVSIINIKPKHTDRFKLMAESIREI